jgi:N6-L-threonylcarbamoyladenine synthase
MKILSIESSADESAVSLVEITGDFPDANYELLGNSLRTQIEMHREYGGIFPAMAKREHAKTLLPLLQQTLKEAELLEEHVSKLEQDEVEELETLLYREPELAENFIDFLQTYDRPEIDAIAVTSGPGLEPALWVGVNFAKAIALAWNIPVVPVNHMEGHILASVFDVEEDNELAKVAFPALALLISGGHTEMVLMNKWGAYEKVGQTRDDAVGEAFDKVARLIGLPYPGGPEISKLAAKGRQQNLPAFADLPRPMIGSDDLDFSFSGLKTAVRYAISEKDLSDTDKQALARDFEDAVTEVLLKKVTKAVDQYSMGSVIVGGGVSANTYIRQQFNSTFLTTHPDLKIFFPNPGLSTDNSIMIALAGHARLAGALSPKGAQTIRADGNKSLA